jgi:hypothetical protein
MELKKLYKWLLDKGGPLELDDARSKGKLLNYAKKHVTEHGHGRCQKTCKASDEFFYIFFGGHWSRISICRFNCDVLRD